MTYKINALKKNEGTDEMVLLDNIFNSTQEAFDFIKSNLSLNNVADNLNVVCMVINDVHYHYLEIIQD
jgi:hypothetical protein